MLHTGNQGDTKRLYVLMTSHLKAVFRTIPKGGFTSARHREPLPTFQQWREVCADNTRVTVREIWGRVLCSVPRTPPLPVAVQRCAFVLLIAKRQYFSVLEREIGGGFRGLLNVSKWVGPRDRIATKPAKRSEIKGGSL